MANFSSKILPPGLSGEVRGATVRRLRRLILPDPASIQAFQALGRLLRPIFSANSNFLFFNIEPTKEEILKARKEKRKQKIFLKRSRDHGSIYRTSYQNRTG